MFISDETPKQSQVHMFSHQKPEIIYDMDGLRLCSMCRI
jgi:hypothetical protein